MHHILQPSRVVKPSQGALRKLCWDCCFFLRLGTSSMLPLQNSVSSVKFSWL